MKRRPSVRKVGRWLGRAGLAIGLIGQIAWVEPISGTDTAACRVPLSAAAPCDPPVADPPADKAVDLDHPASSWSWSCEKQPTAEIRAVSTPSLDGQALALTLTGGEAYSNVNFYRNLVAHPEATYLHLSLSFYYTPTTTFNNQGDPSVVQAIEFAASKWLGGRRWEIAVQWLNVRAGPGQPSLRYWDPHQPGGWVDLGIPVSLAANQWHTLELVGEITPSEQVLYKTLTLDGTTYPLGQIANPVQHSDPDKLAVAVQLDGNHVNAPYTVYVDRVILWHEPPSLLHLPFIARSACLGTC